MRDEVIEVGDGVGAVDLCAPGSVERLVHGVRAVVLDLLRQLAGFTPLQVLHLLGRGAWRGGEIAVILDKELVRTKLEHFVGFRVFELFEAGAGEMIYTRNSLLADSTLLYLGAIHCCYFSHKK